MSVPSTVKKEYDKNEARGINIRKITRMKLITVQIEVLK
tara:strand:+ start:31 stop:147 length:117 start_codon:yes stop_codon:yes gene_type:complete